MTTQAKTGTSVSNLIPVPFEKDEIVNITRDGKTITTSLILADSFGKIHRDVLRTIKNLECSDEFSLRNFAQSDYINERGKKYPMYLITRDGFTILVMGFTGKKAMEWKEKYISAFNEKEELIIDLYRKKYLVTPGRILNRIERIEDKLDTLINSGDQQSPVSFFAKQMCDFSSAYKSVKESLYDAYSDFCDKRYYNKDCKAHFCMKLYAMAPFIKASSITINGRKAPAVKGIMVKEVPYA